MERGRRSSDLIILTIAF